MVWSDIIFYHSPHHFRSTITLMRTILGIPQHKHVHASVRQASQQYHGDLKTKLVDLYERLALFGYGSLPMHAVVVLCVIHLADQDIPKTEIAERLTMADADIRSALKHLRTLELVENGSSLTHRWYYRPTARAIQMLNHGINRRVSQSL